MRALWIVCGIALLCGTGGCRTAHTAGPRTTFSMDPQTGRTWSSPSDEAMEWSRARTWCSKLGAEWRLPTKQELEAFAAHGGRSPHEAELPPVELLFTGELVPGRDDHPWVVRVDGSHAFNGHGRQAHVQCVRALGRIEEEALAAEAERRWAAGCEVIDPGLLPVEDAHVLGLAGAPVTLVFFFDYQCPYCVRADATLQQLVERDPRVRVVYKAAAILDFHPHAAEAHVAAYAAGRQDRFHQARDYLLANGRRFSSSPDEVTAGLIDELGLDPVQFHADLADPALRDRVARETALARAVGVNGLPTTFVNGRRISGSRSLEEFEAAVDEAIP